MLEISQTRAKNQHRRRRPESVGQSNVGFISSITPILQKERMSKTSIVLHCYFESWISIHIYNFTMVGLLHPHQFCHWTFHFNWITIFSSFYLKMRQKQLLFQAEQINLFQSKWSGLKIMVILIENSCHFVNLFSFQLKWFMKVTWLLPMDPYLSLWNRG